MYQKTERKYWKFINKMNQFKYYYKQNLMMQYVTEGLIASYDSESLANKIKMIFPDKIKNIQYSDIKHLETLTNTKYGKIFTIDVELISPLSDEEMVQLNKILNLYGYLNSLHGFDNNRLQIEPKYPVKINDIIERFDNIQLLYHITETKNLDNIQKYGLVPKDTQTIFDHPNDRIYLLWLPYTEDVYPKLYSLLVTLAKNKQINKENMVILKTTYNPKAQYYIDDTSTLTQYGIYGIFTTNNISWNNIRNGLSAIE